MITQNVSLFCWVSNVFAIYFKDRDSRLVFLICFDIAPEALGHSWFAVFGSISIVTFIKVEQIVHVIPMSDFNFFVNCFTQLFELMPVLITFGVSCCVVASLFLPNETSYACVYPW